MDVDVDVNVCVNVNVNVSANANANASVRVLHSFAIDCNRLCKAAMVVVIGSPFIDE